MVACVLRIKRKGEQVLGKNHRVIVAGSRGITEGSVVSEAMNALWDEIGPYTIITGGASGVDDIAAELAELADVENIVMQAEWNVYGKRAGYVRNVRMAESATCLLAIWDGESRGTKLMLDIARKKDLLVRIIYP